MAERQEQVRAQYLQQQRVQSFKVTHGVHPTDIT